MNWVDLVVIAVLAISALHAFLRGFVREVLGILAWGGAVYFAMQTGDLVRDRFRGWIGNPDFADPAAYAAMFVLALIFLSVITSMLGNLVRSTGLGGVDRTIGVAYGVVRGAALVVAAYLAGGFVVAPERWPEAVQQARLLPQVHAAAVYVAGQLPRAYRPSVPELPGQRETRAIDLLHANPQGRATARR